MTAIFVGTNIPWLVAIYFSASAATVLCTMHYQLTEHRTTSICDHTHISLLSMKLRLHGQTQGRTCTSATMWNADSVKWMCVSYREGAGLR